MKKFILATAMACSYLLAGTSVVPHDKNYYTKDVRNTQIIYTKDNRQDAAYVADVEKVLQPMYEEYFGYKMDSTLYVGLVSSNKQVANGFSTQYPLNRQMNFIGGTQIIDYFSNTSWLDSLLYHESAHNYQLNVKDNIVSKSVSYILGNGAFIFPWITVPNIYTSSFMLEGNAVLNESWHGIGGRLYSGRFKAITLMQARENLLTPQLQYNETLEFPYHEHMYINGSYYNYYLAKTYGLKRVNSFWKNNSQDWTLPLYTNNTMYKSVGKDFEDTMVDFQLEMQNEAKNMEIVQGNTIAKSKFFSSLNSDKTEIFFLSNESGYDVPKLVKLNKNNKKVTEETRSFSSGKIIKKDNKYYVQGSRNSNPWRIYQGLLDDSAIFLDGTKSKMVQGYLTNGKCVYFDVKSSYYKAQLYIGDEYYATVNSSVYIDNQDNLYYFIQDGKKRILYKNKTPLFSIKSYYALVSGINSKDDIYFISNSKYGSSLYKFDGKKISRASEADNIIEARLINDDEVLLAAVDANEYYYDITKLKNIDEEPYEVKLFMEDEPYYKKANISRDINYQETLDLDNSYYSFLDMHYSGTDINIGYDQNASFQYNFRIRFSDPLDQNTFSLESSRDLNEVVQVGASYLNNQYFLEYALSAYAVVDKKDNSTDIRDYGVSAQATIPLLQQGYWNSQLSSIYYQDYEVDTRDPLSVGFSISRYEKFGVGLRANSFYALSTYASKNISEDIKKYTNYGANIILHHDLFLESYLTLNAKYVSSNVTFKPRDRTRGIKLSNIQSVLDPTSISMPNSLYIDYLNEAIKASAKYEMAFNNSLYFFTFPISIRRESLYSKYNYYNLSYVQNNTKEIANEYTLGCMLEILLVNISPLPINFEYTINDNPDIAEESKFNVSIGASF